MNDIERRLSENPVRSIYYIDVGIMSRKDAEKVLEYQMDIMRNRLGTKTVSKEGSIFVKIMELLGSSGFGLHF